MVSPISRIVFGICGKEQGGQVLLLLWQTLPKNRTATNYLPNAKTQPPNQQQFPKNAGAFSFFRNGASVHSIALDPSRSVPVTTATRPTILPPWERKSKKDGLPFLTACRIPLVEIFGEDRQAEYRPAVTIFYASSVAVPVQLEPEPARSGVCSPSGAVPVLPCEQRHERLRDDFPMLLQM